MHLSARRYVFLLAFAPALSAQARLSLTDAVSQAMASNPQLAVADGSRGVLRRAFSDRPD